MLKKLGFAVGIPERGRFTPLRTFREPETWNSVLHAHEAYVAGCFPPGTRVLTDQGYLRIGDIVRNKMQVNVKSYNHETGIIEWKPVINWFTNGSTCEWNKLVIFGGKKGLGITSTGKHNIAYFNGDKIEYKFAEELSTNELLPAIDCELSEDQKQFILGSLMGDASITLRDRIKPLFNWGQAETRDGYVELVAKLFNINIEKRAAKGNKTEFSYIRFSHTYLNDLAYKLYTPKKKITKEYLDTLTPKAIAVWFMDDGQWSHAKSQFKNGKADSNTKYYGVNKYSGAFYFYTNGFTEEENIVIQKWFHEKFGIKMTVRERDGYYYLSGCGIKNNKKLFTLIAPYMCENLQYKCPIKVGAYTWKSATEKTETLFPIHIKKNYKFINKQKDSTNKKIYKSNLTKFDIEVADNHNYFVSNVLVSNSHNDLRLHDPETGVVYSFVVQRMPSPGEKVLAIRQQDHDVSAMDFTGKIPRGQYGGGSMKKVFKEPIEITKSEDGKFSFVIHKSGGSERYTLIKPGNFEDNNWLLLNHTPTTKRALPQSKPKYKEIDYTSIDHLNDNQVIGPKLDGAHNLFILRKNKPIETFSYRKSKKSDKLIDHSYKTDLYKTIAKVNKDTVLRGELVAFSNKDNTPLTSSEIAGMLNAGTLKSRALQAEKGSLKPYIFDVDKYEGADTRDLPYAQKLEILKVINANHPQLNLIPLAENLTDKQLLLSDVKTGLNPLTREGVVVYNKDEPIPMKAPLKKNTELRILGFYGASPGSKYDGKAVGGYYASEADNKPKIRVGTGLSDQQRVDMFNNPEKYIGRLATIGYKEKLNSGKYRAPTHQTIRTLW